MSPNSPPLFSSPDLICDVADAVGELEVGPLRPDRDPAEFSVADVGARGVVEEIVALRRFDGGAEKGSSRGPGREDNR